MRIKPAKWRGERPPPPHIFQKARTTSLLSARLFSLDSFLQNSLSYYRELCRKLLNYVCEIFTKQAKTVVHRKKLFFAGDWPRCRGPPFDLNFQKFRSEVKKMADSHLTNIDRRPKRRRDKDNPYTIFTTGINTATPHYYLSFVDCGREKRCIEIDKALFDAFDEFELDDISFMNEVDRHYEQSEQTEQSLNRRAVKPQESVEETVSQRIKVDKLHQAIAQLPEKQRRRLVLYYFGEFTYEQIA